MDYSQMDSGVIDPEDIFRNVVPSNHTPGGDGNPFDTFPLDALAQPNPQPGPLPKYIFNEFAKGANSQQVRDAVEQRFGHKYTDEEIFKLYEEEWTLSDSYNLGRALNEVQMKEPNFVQEVMKKTHDRPWTLDMIIKKIATLLGNTGT